MGHNIKLLQYINLFMMNLALELMNKKQPMKGTFLLASLLTLMFGALFVATSDQVYADIWDDDDTMEELVKDIDNGKDNDDDMDWGDFKDSKVFKQEDIETQGCIENREELSNNLADYEVLHCFEDSDYAY
ncbi:MAG TPA: hypothetical protein VJ250_07225 [Nitrososphaeraceae archaeon]|nr:hypothetical protein [Nitrososphaeraceae archaeon]